MWNSARELHHVWKKWLKKSTKHAKKSQHLQVHFHSGCQASGVYGDKCKEQCPTQCKDQICHIQKGTCFGCAPGWINTTCKTSMITLTFKWTCLFIFCKLFFYWYFIYGTWINKPFVTVMMYELNDFWKANQLFTV